MLISQQLTTYRLAMGCGSSINQVADFKQNSVFKSSGIFGQNSSWQHQNIGIAQARLFLFGETQTHRKIIQINIQTKQAKLLSNRTRIPRPKIAYDPLELMYEESQQIFSPGLYGFCSLPPFNNMFTIYLQEDLLFMCGGVDFDAYNVKNEAFCYQIIDHNTKRQANLSQLNAQSRSRAKPKSKYSNNKFSKVSSMHQKRHSHQGIFYLSHATKHNQEIYVFGGINQNNKIIAHCQKYHLAQNCWTQIPQMKIPRTNGLCLDFLGKIYLFGGSSLEFSREKRIEVYDPVKITWQILNIKLHRGVEKPVLFLSDFNQMLIIGGASQNSVSKSVTRINIFQRTYVWDSQTPLQPVGMKAVSMSDKLYLFSGQSGSQYQIYDKKTCQWNVETLNLDKIISSQQLRQFSFSSVSHNLEYDRNENSKRTLRGASSKSLLFGNDQYPCIIEAAFTEGYVCRTQVPMVLRLKTDMRVVKVSDQQYFLCGGQDFHSKVASKSAYFYNSHSRTAKESMKMFEKRTGFGACLMSGVVFVIGGSDHRNKTVLESGQQYQINSEKWSSIAKLSEARSSCNICAIESLQRLIIFGGYSAANTLVQQIQVYDAKQNTMITIKQSLDAHLCILSHHLFGNLNPNTFQLIILHRDDKRKIFQAYSLVLDLKSCARPQQQKEKYIVVSDQSANKAVIKPNETIINKTSISMLNQKQQLRIVELSKIIRIEADLQQRPATVVRIKPKQMEPQEQSEEENFQFNKIQLQAKTAAMKQGTNQAVLGNQSRRTGWQDPNNQESNKELTNKQSQPTQIAIDNRIPVLKEANRLQLMQIVSIPFDRHYAAIKDQKAVHLFDNEICYSIQFAQPQRINTITNRLTSSKLQGLSLSTLARSNRRE